MGIKSALGIETVDGILASFEKQRTALAGISKKLRDTAVSARLEASKLHERADAAVAEAERADRVHQRISQLID